jgi:hypothetical protein
MRDLGKLSNTNFFTTSEREEYNSPPDATAGLPGNAAGKVDRLVGQLV